jgi:serine/threonine protein kinase/Tfp pilus assembly protein PilF
MVEWNPKANELFACAAEIEGPSERRRFLDQHCGDDAPLRAEVELLLALNDKAGNFLNGPAVPMLTVEEAPVTERPGTMIGPYKLLEQIGEGGFGIVFMAEQQNPVRRKVALKVIKPGMDTKQVVARFEAERQALALMDHPHIAHVLDAGTTDTGRPYFVMELIRGVPITRFCDENQLTPRERLELFLTVCQAVQHAHQKGIIHRDLKPSNVLVTLLDGTPTVKVIDFGIAKALGQERLTDKTLFTGFAQMIGTPLYMSPEQAEMSGRDVDTRTDIYALGVLLYELLTGTTPFDQERLKEVSYDELRRIIREEEPARPSTRISTLGQAATTVSANRKSEPRRLSQLFRGELDWMVMKALEKDRNRRYDTASSFAADIQRYLHGEPVQASPLGTGYRVRKFIQKHKKPLLLIVAVVALLLSAVVIGKAQRDARQAQQNARQAQLSRSVNEALNQATALREQAKAATVGSAALFARAREQMQRALALAEDGLADAALTAQVSQLQAELDAEDKDRTLVAALDEAWLAQAETLSENRFATERAVPKIRAAFRAYGLAAGEGEPAVAAERIRRRPVAVQEAIVAALEEWDNLAGDPTLPITEPHRAWLRAVVAAAEPGDAWTKALRAALAEAHGVKRRASLEQLAAAVDVRHHPPLTLTRLAKRLEGIKPAGTPYAAGPAAVALLRRAQRQYPADFWINEFLGMGLDQGTYEKGSDPLHVEGQRGQKGEQDWAWTGGLTPFRTHAEERTEAVRFLTAAVALRPESPGAHYNLGNALRHKGQFDEAIGCYQQALALDPKYALAHNNLGIALEAKGQVDAAIVSYRTAIALDPKYPGAHDNLGMALYNRKHDYDGALACYRTAIELDPKFANAHNNLGAILCDVKRDYDGAIACFRTALALDPKFAVAHHNLGEALRHKGQGDQAIVSFRTAIALDPKNAEWHCNLGEALARQGRFAESLEAYKRGHELGTKQPGWRYPSADWVRNAERLAALETSREIAAGRTQDALVYLAALSAAKPDDTFLFQTLAALQAWFGRDQELAATCRRGLEWAKNTTDPATADRVAKACCVLPWTDKTPHDAVLALARKAVELGKASHHVYLPYFLMAQGMAEYRSGHWAEADAALLAAAKSAKGNFYVADTSALYRAMSLFRQGKEQEARQLAMEVFSRIKPLPKDEKNPLAGNANNDDLILWLAYKEAKALIQFEATPASLPGR